MTLSVGHRPQTSDPGTRGFWPLRDLPGVFWMIAVVVVSAAHPFLPAPRWLMIHLFVLGAAGHSILVWSRYFADTLLRIPTTPRRRQTPRLVLFNLGVLAVVAGVPWERWWLVVAGAAGVVAAVLWHVSSLIDGLRSRFSSRFATTIWFYVAAGLLLVAGAVLGTWLSFDPGEPLETRLRMAHVALNVLGFVGLTVTGTIITLGPTMLRTRIPDGAEHRARASLWLMLAGIALIQAAAWLDQVTLVVAGLTAYAVGVAVVARDLARAALRKPPTSYPTWSLLAGVAWFIALLVALATRITVGLPDHTSGPAAWVSLGTALEWLTPYFAAGFVAQVLLGALSYLVPVVMGGGPAAVRSMNRDLDAGGALRVSVVNLGLLICVLPVPSLVRVIASALALIGLASFVPVLLRGVRRRHGEVGPPEVTDRPAGQNKGLLAVGVVAAMLAVAVGGAVAPTSLDGPVQSAANGVAATGHTVQVRVEAANMRFTPSRIEVNAGDRLVITVVNTDADDVHDLVLETGHDSGRLAPGEKAEIDVGVVGRGVDGWCSVVGHRQMGMVLQIVATGAPAAGTEDTGDSGNASDHDGTSSGGHDHGSMGEPAMGDEPADDTVIPDPTLLPAEPGRVHRHTFRITEQDAEVAPGVIQRQWTYNGTAPGPTLHGKVGDTFVITLVNDGTMGHSIDFHAGMRATDKVMRTIPPGESLTYRFVAQRSGIWMYHCATMPMSAHIAAGLYGAVVIDPPDLPEVDHSYLLIQSEQYYGDDGPDMDKINAEQPDAVVFNGYHNAYTHEPIRVKRGERVRIWLLNAGPNRPLAFHVVGGQFDTTYLEGDWVLGSRDGPSTTGGAQTMGLLPAQGGFVEFTLDEPGTYRLVNHVMVDAERGAHGTLIVE